MVKKTLLIALGLVLSLGAFAQGFSPKSVTVNEDDVMFWTGSGTNSTLVAIGWDAVSASYTPTVVVWGVRWNGNISLLNALDTVAAYDEHFSYVMGSSGFLQTLSYINPDLGLSLTPVVEYNCNSYGSAYGSGTLGSTWLRISESTCSDYDFSTVNNIVYPVDPALASSCPKPVSASVSNITATSVDFAFVDTAHVGNYMVRFMEGNVVTDSFATVDTSHTFSGLTANTAYTVSVSAICPDSTETFAVRVSFRTPCVTVAHSELPWSEDFDALDGDVIASTGAAFVSNLFCWTVPNPPAYNYLYINSSSTYNPDGGKCVYVGDASNRHPVMVLPVFEDTPSQLMLTLDVRSAYSGSGVEVGVITNPTLDSTFVPVAVCEPAAGSGFETFSVTFAGHTTGRLAIRARNSACAIDNVVVEQLPSCVKPSMLTVADLDAHSATINIFDPNNTLHYWLMTSADDSVEVTSASHTLSGLEANTHYTVRVRTVCADGLTDATAVSFRTGCDSYAIPYAEDFDSYTDLATDYSSALRGDVIPCWSRFKAVATAGYMSLFTRSQGSSYAYGQTGYTLRLMPSSTAGRDLFVLPEFDSELSTLEMTLALKAYSITSGTLELGYVTDAADSSTFVAVSTLAASGFTSEFVHESATFTSAPEGARVALRMAATSTSGCWYVDDINVHELPFCERIQAVSVSGVAATEATLHIDDSAFVGTYRCTLSTAASDTSFLIYDTLFTLTDLLPATDYTVSVAAVCSDGYVTLSRAAQFTTGCAPIAELPFFEGFEGWATTAVGGLPHCWDRAYWNLTTVSHNSYPYAMTSPVYEGNRSLKLYSYANTTTGASHYAAIFLPEFEEPVSNLKVSFQYKAGNTNYSRLRLLVGVSESVADTSTFTRLATIIPADNNWNEYEVDLSAYTGTGTRITIVQTSTISTYITSALDNLVVDTFRTCNRPDVVEMAEVGARSATVRWSDAANAGSYLVSCIGAGDTLNAEVTGDSLHTFTGLEPGTDYTVAVRSMCYGEPTDARLTSFTTSCDAYTMPWLADFDNISSLTALFPCWAIFNGLYDDATGTATLAASTSGWVRTNIALDSSNHFKVNVYGTSLKRWLVTPEVEVSDSALLKFDMALTDYGNASPIEEVNNGLDDDRFIVFATADNCTTWTELGRWTSATTPAFADIPATGDSACLSLAQFVGQTVRIGFYVESTVSGADNDLHLDNIRVEAVSQPTVDTVEVPQPVEAVVDPDDILYWVGEGHYSAVLAVNWADTALAWGYRFADANVSVSTMMDDIAAADSRFAYTVGGGLLSDILFSDSTTADTLRATPGNYWESTTNGISNAGLSAVLADGDFVKWADPAAGTIADSVYNDGYGWIYSRVYEMEIHPVSEPASDTTVVEPQPEDASFAAADILYWVGSGSNEVVLAINWADTALAWGYRFDSDSVSVINMVTDIADADPRLEVYGFNDYLSDFVFDDHGDTLRITPHDVYDYSIYFNLQVNHVSSLVGAGEHMVGNGDFVKFADTYAAVKLDSVWDDFYFEWSYTYVWPNAIYPVSVPDTASDTTIVVPQPVDATIAASDILYWVGQGEGQVVMAFNWADTVLAWGVHFGGTGLTVADAMDTIAAYDSRFTYAAAGGWLNGIVFTENGVAHEADPADFWFSSLNGSGASMGMTQGLVDGDFFKWGVLSQATGVGEMNDYGYYDAYVFTSAVHAVTAPSVGIDAREAVAFSVYPNPAIDRVSVVSPVAAEAVLFDLQGRQVLSLTLAEGVNTVDLTSLPSGIFMLHANNQVYKIVKR